MYQLILVAHMLAALFLIVLVLLQQGKGATVGAAFGSGASQTVFGSRGSGSFLLRITIGFVIIFFATSITLNYLASREIKQTKVIDLPTTTQEVPVPTVSPNSIPVEPPQLPIGNTKK